MDNGVWRGFAIFLGIAALAAGGGYGFGRWQTMAAAQPAAAPAAKPGDGKITDGVGPFYIEVGQLMVPVLADGRTTAFILTQITLEADSLDNANRLRRHLPHARNALLQGLFGLAGTGFFDGPTVDPAAASGALWQAANEQLGGGMVKTVLIDRLLRQENTRS